MTAAVRRFLAVLVVLQALGFVACVLLAIWGSDDRWGYTAVLLFFTAFITGAVALP